MSSGDLFLEEIENIREYVKTKVARVHQMLQKRERALLSELQQLEDTYKGEGVAEQIDQLIITIEHSIATLTSNESKDILEQSVVLLHTRMRELEANLETARDRMRRVDLEWDINLEGILSRTGSIRVVFDYSLKGNSAMLVDDHTKTRDQAACEAKTEPLLTANNHDILSKCNENHSFNLTTKESRMNISQTTYSNKLKSGKKQIPAENAPIYSNSKDNLINPTNPSNNSMKPFYSSRTQCKPASTTATILSSNNSSKNKITLRILISPIIPITPNKCIDKTTYTNTSIRGSHESKNDSIQYIRPITEGIPTLGLRNLGNTCYMNSVIQCLSHTLPLRQLYVSDCYRQYLNNKGDLSYAFKHVMLELWKTTSSYSVSPHYLKRQVGIAAPIFSDNRQHDAHEFMRFLLNELHEEINRASEKGRNSPADNKTLEKACARYLTWEDSRISQLFSGMLRSDVCCSVCRHTSTAYVPFLDLSLPIPERKQRPYHLYSLNDCLDVIITLDTLTEEDRPYCNNCKKLTESTKQLALAQLPKFLVIQLKRFSNYSKSTKLSTPVKFHDTWVLKDSKNTHTYSLYGIVSHSGSIHGGHYIAYCKYKDDWRCFNDEWAYTVSWEQVKLQEAYILFYRDVL